MEIRKMLIYVKLDHMLYSIKYGILWLRNKQQNQAKYIFCHIFASI